MKTPKAVYFPDDLLQEVTKLAQEQERSFTQMAILIIKAGLAVLKGQLPKTESHVIGGFSRTPETSRTPLPTSKQIQKPFVRQQVQYDPEKEIIYEPVTQ